MKIRKISLLFRKIKNNSNFKLYLIALFIKLFLFVYFGKDYLNDLDTEIDINNFGKPILTEDQRLIFETVGVSYVPNKDRFNIFLIWYGKQLPDVYFKGLETIIFHHPKCDVLLFSNELSESILLPIREKGYNNTRIVRFNMTKMVENKIGYDFVEKANKLINGEKIGNLKITRVHLSDFLRYFLVYTYGGLYLDTDSFVIKNMEDLRNMISVREEFSFICSNKVYSTPKLKSFTCVSNGVYHFEKNHPLMRDAVINYDKWWSRNQGYDWWGRNIGYAPAGANMLMELIENSFDRINFLSQNKVLCLEHLSITRNEVNEDDPRLLDALNTCYTIQLLGKGSSSTTLKSFNESFVGRIYQKFKIL
ncbi:unnamed protein product [Brachionus calyciflorus]|uniref:Alpha-1,4-N-acetylglucosaminyltransferase n=1 Tax=Brachionus calyciflorus TaxID=104777 RepID=A0A813MD42_9BILA|nr:unnamed protein product [Brachionus calyciflorus]